MALSETIAVSGMHCGCCERRLSTALTRHEGVIKASADHQAGQVRVRYDPDRVSPADVEERIRTAGYEVY